jgi:hypothetical protein
MICQWCEHDRPDVEKVMDPVLAALDGEFVEVEICGSCYKDRCYEI